MFTIFFVWTYMPPLRVILLLLHLNSSYTWISVINLPNYIAFSGILNYKSSVELQTGKKMTCLSDLSVNNNLEYVACICILSQRVDTVQLPNPNLLLQS